MKTGCLRVNPGRRAFLVQRRGQALSGDNENRKPGIRIFNTINRCGSCRIEDHDPGCGRSVTRIGPGRQGRQGARGKSRLSGCTIALHGPRCRCRKVLRRLTSTASSGRKGAASRSFPAPGLCRSSPFRRYRRDRAPRTRTTSRRHAPAGTKRSRITDRDGLPWSRCRLRHDCWKYVGRDAARVGHSSHVGSDAQVLTSRKAIAIVVPVTRN